MNPKNRCRETGECIRFILSDFVIVFRYYKPPKAHCQAQKTVQDLGPPGSQESADPWAESGQRRTRVRKLAWVGSCKIRIRRFRKASRGEAEGSRSIPPGPYERGRTLPDTTGLIGRNWPIAATAEIAIAARERSRPASSGAPRLDRRTRRHQQVAPRRKAPALGQSAGPISHLSLSVLR